MSVAAQGDAGGSPVSVVSVGAICSASADAAAVFSGAFANPSCLDRNNSTIEFFSSRGPTLDGRTKPDIASIDGVSVTAAGSFEKPFFGTSAAAPHAAGIAALTLQAAPCLVAGAPGAVDTVTARTALRDMLLRGAVPLSSPSPDNTFGAGRADALRSVQRALPAYGRSATAISVSGNTPLGASITPSQLGFTDPNQCGLTRLTWTGGCGTGPAAAMNCPFGTTSVSVGASNNGVSFSPPIALELTVTNFSVAASPASATIDAGQSTRYQVTVSPQSGAFSGSITLACGNLPPGANCAFEPASVTPGSSPVQSTVTVTTSARSGGSYGVPGSAFRVPSAGVRVPGPPWSLLAVLLLGVWLVPVAMRLPRQAGGWGRTLLVSTAAASALVLMAFQAGCGSGGGGSTGSTVPTTPATTTVSVTPASLTFGSQSVGTTSVPQAVTLSNTGSATLAIWSIGAAGDFAQSNTCGTSLAAGASCAVSVTFTPTAAGARTGSLSIANNAATSPQAVALTGTGASASTGTPAGTYSINVAGTSGTLVQTSTVSLVVR
jgi:hypothetical protein